ncbi:MAG: BREX-6 system phosphatase PglZ [Deltaproteobacteria bacterium]|nr:BREX-6 system phosphatase PglZ [Deltaproteobacteria bacterium]
MKSEAASMGPVSAKLEAELREEVRRNGIVFFLDKEGAYTGLIDRIAATSEAVPYPVCTFRGSFLELMLALEHHAAGVDATPLLVHLPGFTEETVKTSPLYELRAAGVSFKRSLDTLITTAAAGRVRPEQIESFRTQGSLTLDGADAWLSALVADAGEGLTAQLRNMSLAAIVDDLLSAGFIAGRIQTTDDAEATWQHFARTTGLPDEWRDEYEGRKVPRARDVAFTVASWALVVEYTMDLFNRGPADPRLARIPQLPKSVIEACRALADHLRTRHPAFYENTANETETWLPDETSIVRAEDLGKIDTFLFEESAILKAALDALNASNFDPVLAWALPRAAAKSFWTQQAPLRQNAWQLILDAARLGKAIVDAGSSLGPVRSVDGAMDRYVSKGASVDRAHRLLEQRRLAVLYPQVPHFEVLRARLDEMRGRWRAWADAWAQQWNDICRTHGFLPSPDLQQRTLFDQVVKNLAVDSATPNDITAYFMVDALRFEMAQELFDALGDIPATQKQLKARLAELPTVTEVGMNVLAPVVENGRLKPALQVDAVKGFATGEYRVFNPETRKRAMFERIGGKTCPWLTLEDVLTREATSLKKAIEQARLVVVHSQEIDNAGEKGVGASVFDKVLQDLRAAWRLLREAGVRRFVITADHGFLLLDDRLGEAKAHGRKIDPKRRHIFSPVPADHTGEIRVALKDLGYDGVDGHVMFPETVTVFDTGTRSQNFVHGGNSPQERVIPVLTLIHKQPAGSDSHTYVVSAQAADGVAGMHCLQGRVEVAVDSLFGGKKSIELGLRALDAPDGVIVEIGQTRGGARVGGSVIHADVGGSFEVFFRLLGPTDARLRVELWHTGGDATVRGAVIDSRFAVTPQPVAAPTATVKAPTTATSSTTWVQELPTSGVRQVFEHLAAHGAITETEAAGMLGSQRELRKFAREFEAHAARAPFRVRIDIVGGIKRYVREGGEG